MRAQYYLQYFIKRIDDCFDNYYTAESVLCFLFAFFIFRLCNVIAIRQSVSSAIILKIFPFQAIIDLFLSVLPLYCLSIKLILNVDII